MKLIGSASNGSFDREHLRELLRGVACVLNAEDERAACVSPAVRSAVWWFDALILALIVANVLAAIVGTVGEVRAQYATPLRVFEVVSVGVFSAEYLLRLWAAGADPRYRGLTGRLRYVFSPMAQVDLWAVLPFYLPFLGVDLRVLRSLRLLRIFRLLKVTRYLPSLRRLQRVFVTKKEELVVSSVVLVLLLVIASSVMYHAEHRAQPDVFTDIPTTMWWAVATLTTVGYGDAYPITAAGKLLGAAIAILGISFFALPTSILADGFREELADRRRHADRTAGSLDASSGDGFRTGVEHPAGDAIPAGDITAVEAATETRLHG